MARYQMVFRNGSGDHIMLVDDPSGEGEPLAYLHQPLQMGAAIHTNGNTWIVVGDSDHDGIHRFTCDPVKNDANVIDARQARRRSINDASAVRAWPPKIQRN